MAQPNVAREPSMDEILASIRRIIESNEPLSLDSFEDGFETKSDVNEDASDASEMAAPYLTADLSAQDNRPSAINESAPSPQPLSLADVAARVRGSAGRNTVADTQPVPENVMPFRFQNKEEDKSEVGAEIGSEAFSEPMAAKGTESEPEFAVEPHVSPSVTVSAPEVAGIVSPQVGQQVARSFDDLSQAIHATPRRSFDEIAQEMLRPLLQEWLDNNLPTLVERLVREEIERVARGPRR
ncbi:DUF2497 domain-containing protein [Rhizobium sp. CFBP 8762]|uniref:PopZ family protein n=1 Tax=Rhizobium sp. CFBP 8762 TaxID=2775279 RepID=UPI00177EDF6B|nr:PopZ family protein [Rhizobium sp. CFBP 8762]MBD8554637.1 DUF2497 domain-containing protein [Rhizobium sp. CFBP 8762]